LVGLRLCASIAHWRGDLEARQAVSRERDEDKPQTVRRHAVEGTAAGCPFPLKTRKSQPLLMFAHALLRQPGGAVAV
jgi:hypothetical protein